MKLPPLPEKVTYYGRASDPFTRVVEHYRWERVGDGTNDVNLVIDRKIYARGYLDSVVVDVGFASEPKTIEGTVSFKETDE